MSFRESIQIFCQFDHEEYLTILQRDFGAREHPSQSGSYLIDDPELPFYRPVESEEYLFIMGFNYAPLSSLLIHALVEHPGLIPPETIVRWIAEQELLLENTIEEIGKLRHFR